MEVREVMSSSVFTVRRETPLKEAVRLMDRRGVSGLPVVDQHRKVVGVLSEADLVIKEAGDRGLPRRRFQWLLGDDALRAARAKIDAATAGEAMTSPAVTIGPSESVREAASLMVGRGINRLPVVEEGRLVGIVTRADVARAFLRTDEEIAQAIREELLRRTLWIDPNTIEVEVDQGVARLTGTVERRSTAEMLGGLVQRLDGVVRVEADLGWAFDDQDLKPPQPDLVSRPGA